MITGIRVTIASLIAAVATLLTQAQSEQLSQYLDQYAAGDFHAADLVAVTPQAFTQFRASLVGQAPGWIARDGPTAAPARRNNVAAFALEVLHANGVYWGHLTTQHQYDLGPYWQRGPLQFDSRLHDAVVSQFPEIVEWAWALVEGSSSQSFQNEWAFAAVTLMWDELADSSYVFGTSQMPPDAQAAERQQIGVPLGFLDRVLARFPDDSRLAIRAAVGGPTYVYPLNQELASRISTRREIPYDKARDIIRRGAALREAQQLNSKDLQLGIGDRDLLSESRNLADLLEVAKRLMPFERAPEVRADADLEEGMIAMCFAKHDDARRLFDDVLQSGSTSCQAFHAHYLRGRVDEEDGRVGDAERDYLQALEAVPSAQSAVTSLASLFWLQGRPSDAAGVVSRELARPAQHDPWGWVLSVPCSQWPQAISALRPNLR